MRIPSPIPLGFHHRQPYIYISLDRTLQTYKTLLSESFTILKSESMAKYRVFKTTRKIVLKVFKNLPFWPKLAIILSKVVVLKNRLWALHLGANSRVRGSRCKLTHDKEHFDVE